MSSPDHDIRILFWVISGPDTATPPAFAALLGAYMIFASLYVFKLFYKNQFFSIDAIRIQLRI